MKRFISLGVLSFGLVLGSGAQAVQVFPCKAAISEYEIGSDGGLTEIPREKPEKSSDPSPYEIGETPKDQHDYPRPPDVQPGLQEVPAEEPKKPEHVDVPEHIRQKILDEVWKKPGKPNSN